MKTDKFIIIANLVYILGIIMGLYLQISIVFLLCLTLVSILYLIIKSNIKEIIHDKIIQERTVRAVLFLCPALLKKNDLS